MRSISGVGLRKKRPSFGEGEEERGGKCVPSIPSPPLLPVFYDSLITTCEQILVLALCWPTPSSLQKSVFTIKIISTFLLLHWSFLTTFSTLTALKRSASTLSIKHIRKFFDRPGNMTQEMLRWWWKNKHIHQIKSRLLLLKMFFFFLRSCD